MGCISRWKKDFSAKMQKQLCLMLFYLLELNTRCAYPSMILPNNNNNNNSTETYILLVHALFLTVLLLLRVQKLFQAVCLLLEQTIAFLCFSNLLGQVLHQLLKFLHRSVVFVYLRKYCTVTLSKYGKYNMISHVFDCWIPFEEQDCAIFFFL